MKKFLLVLLFLSAFATVTAADVIQLDGGTYTSPEDYAVMAQLDFNVALSHNRFYSWGLEDLNVASGVVPASIEIVFHNIYDESGTENWLNLYIFNGPVDVTYDFNGRDESDPTLPDWTSMYPTATYVGTWQYDHSLYTDGETFDVVFTIEDEELLAFLTDGGTWGLGFDPDCYFRTTGVSVYAPVPEPATMLLFGIGLLGLAGFSRRKVDQ